MSTNRAGLLHGTRTFPEASRETFEDARQWHRRGLRSPAEIAAIVHARVHGLPEPTMSGPLDVDPAYGDFFIEPTA